MSSRGNCLLGRTSPPACHFAEPQWRKWLNFGRYPCLPDRQFGWASSNSLKAESHFGQWLILIPKLWQMCLRPCPHTEQHRWFSYSISASNSITEQQRLGQILVPHPHTAEWFILWTHFHTHMRQRLFNFWDCATKSYLFLWNRWQWKSLNFCSFLLHGWMFAGRRSHPSPPSVTVNFPLHSLFSICFYFSLKTF